MPDAAASSLPGEPAPPPPAGDEPRGRVLFHLGPLAVTPRILTRTLLAAAAILALSLLWGRIDIEDLHARARALSAAAVIGAITVLPLVGFPVSLLHLVAGVRFDFWGGMLVVGVTTVLHHMLGWALVRVLPRRCFDRLGPWREKLRGAGYLDTTLLCCLLPGMPYTVQLYLKPLIGMPLRLLFGLSPSLHTARAVVTILLGDLSDDLTPGRMALLVLYYVVLFGISGFSLRRLRRTIAMKTADPHHAQVAARASYLWQLAGSPPRRDLEFWFQAEAELKKDQAQTAEQSRGQPAGALSPRPSTPSESAQPRA